MRTPRAWRERARAAGSVFFWEAVVVMAAAVFAVGVAAVVLLIV